MAIDPRTAFHALIQAWEEYHAAVLATEDGEAPRVLRAADRLADAYTVYDDVLFTNFGVEAPFDTFDDDGDDDYDDDCSGAYLFDRDDLDGDYDDLTDDFEDEDEDDEDGEDFE